MKNIFGILSRNKHHNISLMLQKMLASVTHNKPHEGQLWSDNGIGLGQIYPNYSNTLLPIFNAKCKTIFRATGRVDNISELGHLLNIPVSAHHTMSDIDWMQLAYDKWGENCTKRIYGDWVFAAWHPDERRLFLARDHFGNTALYYYVDHNIFAFASSRQALLDLNLAPIQLDELYLAQILITWTAYHGERTIHSPIRRLPPAHTLTISKDNFETRQYWYLEETQPLQLHSRNDYVNALQEVFDEAVHARLRITEDNCGDSPIAVTLSGGLDSSSVAVTAAKFLRQEGRRLKAFTSIPLSNTDKFVGSNFGDEFPFAAATAQFAGNIDHYSVDAVETTPIQGVRRMLQIIREPAHAAGNFYWILALERAVRDNGCNILLTGQMGNAGISWAGDIFSQPLYYQLQHIALYKWVKEKVKRSTPNAWFSLYRHWRQHSKEWYRSSAIHPDFARRINLLERRLSDPNELAFKIALQKRLYINPGRNIAGCLHAEMAAAHNIEIRDPTADARVLEFAFSVPDHIFIDPKTGINRWLIREAMKGRLPDQVRLNRKTGRQAGDRVQRLRASAIEVDVTLNELSQGPAAEYVDVDYMRQVWQMIRTDDTPEAFHKSGTILLRGIMAGLFVNDFYK